VSMWTWKKCCSWSDRVYISKRSGPEISGPLFLWWKQGIKIFRCWAFIWKTHPRKRTSLHTPSCRGEFLARALKVDEALCGCSPLEEGLGVCVWK